MDELRGCLALKVKASGRFYEKMQFGIVRPLRIKTINPNLEERQLS